MHETREFMDVFADQLPEDIIILDASTIKVASFHWAKELLPESCHYIGIAPVVGPQAINDEALKNTEPRADLFEDGLMGIVATPSTQEDAMALAINLAKVLGATPFFIDSHEHDAATAMLEGFPLLLEAALVQVGAGSPGWRELQRMAGVTYAASTQLFATADPEQVGRWLYLNREKVMDRINSLEAELATIRSSLQSENASIRYTQDAANARQAWMNARRRADWEEVQPSPGKEVESVNWFNSLFGFRIRKPKEPSQDS
jgi:prephenate dehydrogenase